jgi:hypothetical protein
LRETEKYGIRKPRAVATSHATGSGSPSSWRVRRLSRREYSVSLRTNSSRPPPAGVKVADRLSVAKRREVDLRVVETALLERDEAIVAVRQEFGKK